MDRSKDYKQGFEAGEFYGLISQELDLESLLRTVLEYTLRLIGSTNAAIYLPSTSGDYTLGAYVSYDCPKDSAQLIFDQIADMAHLLADNQIVALRTGFPGQAWLEDSCVATFSCIEDADCLAVVILFRDKRTPISCGNDVPRLEMIREFFGKQLAKVIKTHHRHQPKHQWDGFASGDEVA